MTKKEINSDNLVNILIDKINILEKENQLLKDKLNGIYLKKKFK